MKASLGEVYEDISQCKNDLQKFTELETDRVHKNMLRELHTMADQMLIRIEEIIKAKGYSL